MQNICRFIPPNKTAEHIQPINFVYETNTQTPQELTPCTVYRIHFVTDGVGEVCCGDTVRTVRKGDIFFAFPAVCTTISSVENFRYMYISYIGIRAGAEMERLGINTKNFIFEECEDIRAVWDIGIGASPELIDIMSEGVLMYTLARLGERRLSDRRISSVSLAASNFTLIKRYIDTNFADPALSCESIAHHFCYNKKYISTLFKKSFQIGISEYINTVRINHACALIEEGYRSVGEIASAVGFNDALYFSRVFKKKTGEAPRQFMELTDKRACAKEEEQS